MTGPAGPTRLAWRTLAPADLFDHLHPQEHINMRAPKRPRSVKVSDDLWLAAQATAERRGEVLSEVIRAALERYVKRS